MLNRKMKRISISKHHKYPIRTGPNQLYPTCGKAGMRFGRQAAGIWELLDHPIQTYSACRFLSAIILRHVRTSYYSLGLIPGKYKVMQVTAILLKFGNLKY